MARRTLIFQVVLLAVVVFLSRVPFLRNGLGTDPDAWRVANTARSIALSGMYSYSRPPGYPFQEIFYSLMWNASPILFNAVSAIFSVVAFVFFALILSRINCRRPIFGALALVFIPVVFINSATSMDYVWALAFILGSFYFALDHKYVLAGVFLGLAIGCRLTSAGMILPVSILVYYQSTSRAKSIRTFLAWTIITGVALYIPVIHSYKLDFLTFYEHGYPFYLTIIKQTSLGVWGVLGSLAMLASAILLGVKFKEIKELFQARDPIFLASATAVAIYALIYIRLPHEAGYLIPALPFLLVILCKVGGARWFAGVCTVLIISPMFLHLDNRQLSWSGPIFQDRLSRIQSMQFTAEVLYQAAQVKENSVVLAGYYLPELEWHLYKNPREHVKFIYLATREQLIELRQQGRQIYTLPQIDNYNSDIYGVNPSDFGGVQLWPGAP